MNNDENLTREQNNNFSSIVPNNTMVSNSTPSSQIPNLVSEPKKSGKGLKIFAIILAVLMFAFVGCYFYIKTTFTAETFIDKVISRANKLVGNSFNAVGIEKINFLDQEIKTSSSLKLSSTSENFAPLNNLTIDFSTGINVKEEYMNVGASVKQDAESITAKALIDKNTLYIESKDLFTDNYKTLIGNNFFQVLKETMNNQNKVSFEDIRYYLTKSIEYYGEALKEVESSTKITGTKAIYEYTINSQNVSKFNAKFKELATSDTKYQDIKKRYSSGDMFALTIDDNIPNLHDGESLVYNIKYNILSNSIESFKISYANGLTGSYESHIEGNKIEKDKYKVVLRTTNSSINPPIDEVVGSFDLELNDSKVIATIYDNKDNHIADFELNIKNNNESQIKVNVSSDKFKINANLSITVNGNKADYAGNINILVDGDTFELNIKLSTEYGKNIITKNTINNAIDFDELTDTDAEEISEKFNSNITKIKAFSFISAVIQSLITPNYNYDYGEGSPFTDFDF